MVKKISIAVIREGGHALVAEYEKIGKLVSHDAAVQHITDVLVKDGLSVDWGLDDVDLDMTGVIAASATTSSHE